MKCNKLKFWNATEIKVQITCIHGYLCMFVYVCALLQMRVSTVLYAETGSSWTPFDFDASRSWDRRDLQSTLMSLTPLSGFNTDSTGQLRSCLV